MLDDGEADADWARAHRAARQLDDAEHGGRAVLDQVGIHLRPDRQPVLIGTKDGRPPSPKNGSTSAQPEPHPDSEGAA